MKCFSVFVLLLTPGFFCLCALGFSSWKKNQKILANDYPFRNVSLSWDARVADLVQRLTLEEIQNQMAMGGIQGPAITRLGIGPYQWGTECLRGDVGDGNATAFPQALGLAAAFSPDLIFRVAEATAVEVRGKHNDYVKQGNYGGHTGLSCFSPVINIMRDSRWGRNQETYGEDPFLTGIYATAFIKGLQGNDTRYVRASGGCKHFDVHGGPEDIPVSRFSFDAQVSEEDWRMTFLPAFRMCVEAGTYSLMCSYNRINGIPACANEKLLTEILRNEWGFKGYVVSDGGAIPNIINDHKYYNNTVDTVAGCVNAGCNLELSGSAPVFLSMLDAIKENKLTEAKVREMVAPLFYTRMRLGEFDPPQMNPYNSLSSADVETSEHKALAVEAAMKSFVLLKNNGILPLKALGTIGVVGPMANNADQLFGDYAPVPPPEDVITPLDGLITMAKITQFTSGCDDTNCQVYNASDVLTAIKGTDINFVLLGTGQAVEAEGHDRPDLELPGQQKTLLQDVIANSQDGNFNLQSLAGKLASKNCIILTSLEVARVVEGGLYLDQQCADGILYDIQCNFVSQTSPASEGVPSSQVDVEGGSHHSEDSISSYQSHAEDKTDTASINWSHSAVVLLIETYREKKCQFANPLKKKREVWNDIAGVLKSHNYSYTGDQCDKKWRSLTHRYKTIKDSQKQTGNGRRRWEYFDLMDDVLATSSVIRPLALVSCDDGIAPANIPIVLILFNAGPLNITFADKDPRVSAILECFFPAQASGEALRHVLLNDVKGAVPAGRLPFTWPMTASQLPSMVNYSMTGRTYRYFEGDPLYPFGYGLSYTTFEYPILVTQDAVNAGESLWGAVFVSNNGTMEADEVVQIYIHWRETQAPAPQLQLVWFNRVTVPPGGDAIEVDFEISPMSMALWTPAGWQIEPGIIDLYAGGQQPNQNRTVPSNIIGATFEITGSKFLGKY